MDYATAIAAAELAAPGRPNPFEPEQIVDVSRPLYPCVAVTFAVLGLRAPFESPSTGALETEPLFDACRYLSWLANVYNLAGTVISSIVVPPSGAAAVSTSRYCVGDVSSDAGAIFDAAAATAGSLDPAASKAAAETTATAVIGAHASAVREAFTKHASSAAAELPPASELVVCVPTEESASAFLAAAGAVDQCAQVFGCESRLFFLVCGASPSASRVFVLGRSAAPGRVIPLSEAASSDVIAEALPPAWVREVASPFSHGGVCVASLPVSAATRSLPLHMWRIPTFLNGLRGEVNVSRAVAPVHRRGRTSTVYGVRVYQPTFRGGRFSAFPDAVSSALSLRDFDDAGAGPRPFVLFRHAVHGDFAVTRAAQVAVEAVGDASGFATGRVFRGAESCFTWRTFIEAAAARVGDVHIVGAAEGVSFVARTATAAASFGGGRVLRVREVERAASGPTTPRAVITRRPGT